jgi:hypothetical protein
MKWKDSYDDPNLGDEKEEDKIDEEGYSVWKKNQRHFGFKMMPLPFGLIGIGLLALIILFFIFIPRNQKAVDNDQIVVLQEKIKQLEEKLGQIEGNDEKVAQIWEQAKAFEQFKNRFDRAEASITLRMDQMSKELEALKRSSSVTEVRKTDSSQSAQSTKTAGRKRYHTVRPGESLYSISRSYGKTVDEVRRLNNLSSKALIFPGQKLVVEP